MVLIEKVSYLWLVIIHSGSFPDGILDQQGNLRSSPHKTLMPKIPAIILLETKASLFQCLNRIYQLRSMHALHLITILQYSLVVSESLFRLTITTSPCWSRLKLEDAAILFLNKNNYNVSLILTCIL